MRNLFFYFLFFGLMISCSKTEVSEQENSGESFIYKSGPGCHAFPPNYVLATKANYTLEILESNSDFINHIYLLTGSGDFFIGTDDETGKTVSLPTVKRGSEMIFEIRVHDPDGSPTGQIWQSGDPSRNSDGQIHAIVEKCPGNQYRISFEDIDGSGFGAGDEPNYVDAIFRLF